MATANYLMWIYQDDQALGPKWRAVLMRYINGDKYVRGHWVSVVLCIISSRRASAQWPVSAPIAAVPSYLFIWISYLLFSRMGITVQLAGSGSHNQLAGLNIATRDALAPRVALVGRCGLSRPQLEVNTPFSSTEANQPSEVRRQPTRLRHLETPVGAQVPLKQHKQ